MKRTAPILSRSLSLLLMLACASGQAQTINKCTVDGKVTYTEQPCQAGAAAVIAVPDAPPPRPQAAADLQRMQKQADTLQRERHRREARDDQAQQQAARDARQRNRQCAKLRMEKKWADDDARGAPVQHVERARVKAQRAADRLALECPG